MSGGTSTGGRTPHCPTCGAELHLEVGELPAWLCPAGHGVAATLPAARKRVDDDEDDVWITSPWGEAAENLPSWTQRVVGRGIVRGFIP